MFKFQHLWCDILICPLSIVVVLNMQYIFWFGKNFAVITIAQQINNKLNELSTDSRDNKVLQDLSGCPKKCWQQETYRCSKCFLFVCLTIPDSRASPWRQIMVITLEKPF